MVSSAALIFKDLWASLRRSDVEATIQPTITRKEMQKHFHAEDAWVAIDGKVYDITNYQAQHPGGSLLLQSAGRDVSAEFHALHHRAALKALEKLPCVGQLEDDARELTRTSDEMRIQTDFIQWAMSPSLPCIGAKISLARKAFDICVCDMPLGSSGNAEYVAKKLRGWRSSQQSEWDHRNPFTTFVVVFPSTPPCTEVDFEKNATIELRNLMRTDGAPWPSGMPTDAAHPKYMFSFDGQSYFVVGLHPGSSRPGRRFKYAALVFNAKRQFDVLRQGNEFQQIQKIVRRRDTVLSGSPNPCVVAELPALQQMSGYDHTQDNVAWSPEL